MKALVKHHRSLLSKDKGWKGSLPKPPSSPGSIQPPSPSMTFSLSNVDDRITDHISALSDSFDRKLDALTIVLLDKFSSFASLDQANVSARLPNRSVSAPPKVPVPGPSHGQDPSFPTSEGIVSSHQEFQGDGMGRVPSGSRTPFPSARGELPVVREVSGLGSGSVQAPSASVAGPEQPAEVRHRAQVTFDLPPSASSVAPDVEEEDRDSVVSSPPVADRTLIRLVNFIYDKYPKSRPLSSPLLAPRCGLESLYAVFDCQETLRPRFRLYPRVGELLDKTCEHAATLAKGSKLLSAILPKKRRLHNVADVPGFATPLTLSPDFSQLAEHKSISKKHMGSVTFS